MNIKSNIRTYTYTDEQLLDFVAKGDHIAFNEIYERYWDRLLSVAVNRLDNEEDAEECVQDVFLSLWNRRETTKLKYKLSTYLWAAVKYQIINRLNTRYALKNQFVHEDMPEVRVPAADVPLLEKELMETIENTVLDYYFRFDQGVWLIS